MEDPDKIWQPLCAQQSVRDSDLSNKPANGIVIRIKRAAADPFERVGYLSSAEEGSVPSPPAIQETQIMRNEEISVCRPS